MVEHANEPPSFQANSVDVGIPSCIRGGDLKVFKLFNHVQDSVIDKQGKGGKFGVGFLENSR